MEREEKKHHDLKTVQPYFDLVKSGLKTFEVRLNDRDFKKGDTVTLREYIPFPYEGEFTGQKIEATINYVLKEYEALKNNYVVFGLSLLPTVTEFTIFAVLTKKNTMKLTNLSESYLSGCIDMILANYNERNSTIPEELELSYTMEWKDFNVVMFGNDPCAKDPKSVKISFHYSKTKFVEDKQDSDCIILVKGEKLINLQNYVEEILNRLIAE